MRDISRTMAFAVSLLIASTALAQVDPDVGYVYPAGGRQGTAVDVEVGGQNLRGVTGALISGAGALAELVEYTRPMTQKEFNQLRELGQQLQRRKAAAQKPGGDGGRPPGAPTWSAEDEQRLASVRARIADRFRRQAIPALAETAVLRVTLAPDAEVGRRELRLVTAAGLSNPLVFCVGDLPEFAEDVRARPARDSRGAQARDAGTGGRARQDTRIALPAVANGRVLAGDVDRFRFDAREGQRLVVRASARELIPYLADAVPGWFQATLTLRDAHGDEIAYVDDFRFDPDPTLCHRIPADGEYVVEIRDAIHRGREDFVYRIAIGELPHVTSLFPLGGSARGATRVAIAGWNLPVRDLVIPPEPGVRVSSVVVRADGASSNALPFARDTRVGVAEREPNDSPATAQPLTQASVVDGRILTPGDLDVFRFEGRAGQEVVAEVSARRLRSPLDSYLLLTDAAGRRIAFNDDRVDEGAGLDTHHADSWLRSTLPASGEYYLHLGDVQRHGGEEYGYRLRIGPPRPDFELRVAPSAINARAGGATPFTVHALRRDGFSGEISLRLRDAPAGFALSGGRVPAGATSVRLTLTAPRAPLAEPVRLVLEGRGENAGRAVVRTAVAADDAMQAFIYHHLVPSTGLLAAVTGRAGTGAPLRLASDAPVVIPAGGSARVGIIAPRRGGAVVGIEVELSEPPPGITLGQVSRSREGIDVVLHADGIDATPGTRGNLIVRVYAAGTPATDAAPAGRATRRRLLGTLPAISFDVVAAERAADGRSP